jgi:hypothetical protein
MEYTIEQWDTSTTKCTELNCLRKYKIEQSEINNKMQQDNQAGVYNLMLKTLTLFTFIDISSKLPYQQVTETSTNTSGFQR